MNQWDMMDCLMTNSDKGGKSRNFGNENKRVYSPYLSYSGQIECFLLFSAEGLHCQKAVTYGGCKYCSICWVYRGGKYRNDCKNNLSYFP